MDFLTNILNMLMGKKPETPEEHIARLEVLAKVEADNTVELKKKVDEANRIKELQTKIIGDRKAQAEMYATLGVDSPQVVKSKKIRQYVYIGIVLIVVIVIAKSCFH